MEPDFLWLEDALEIHQDQIQRYGGREGIRDVRLLASALAMPRAGIGNEYVHADLFEQAAAYLFHIVKNHPFVDGNKRVAAMAAFVFLKLNGITLQASNRAFERLVAAAAEGKADKAKITAFLRRHTT